MDEKVLISVLALVLAIITLALRLLDERRSYIQIGMQVAAASSSRFAIAKTTICNKSIRIKKLGRVFLLIGPQNEDPVVTFNTVLGPNSRSNACCAVDFERLAPSCASVDEGGTRWIVPLPYFTEENDNVGDEELAYSYPIDTACFPSGAVLSVRFIVYGYRRSRQNYHRKVHDLLFIPETENAIQVGNALAELDTPREPEQRSELYGPAPCVGLRGCQRKVREKVEKTSR